MTADAALPAHSILGASSMYRWSACPGSVELCRHIPPTESIYAKEGTHVHELASAFLKGDMTTDAFWRLPAEQRDCIQLYYDTLADDFLGKKWPSTPSDLHKNHIYIEHRFDLSSVFPGCFGTADAVIWNDEEKILRVYDYKHGAGVIVEVEGNQQMLYYALGAIVTLKYPARTIEIVVVQPRARHKNGPVRRWRIPAIDILEFEADLVAAAERTQQKDAPLNPGRHCFFCPAKADCPAKKQEKIRHAQNVFSVVEEETNDIFS